MAPLSLFVGVVSHTGSRFEVSQGPGGLGAKLAATLPETVVQVNTENLIDEAHWTIDAAQVQRSLTAELALEHEWEDFLGRPRTLRRSATNLARRLRRLWYRVQPPSPAMVRRLVNIELSHLNLMRSGLESDANWILVIEDDAFAEDVEDLAQGISGLMTANPPAAYVNISESFSTTELGIDHLLEPVVHARWGGRRERSLLQAKRPVTNTVCAILYRREFLLGLVDAMDALPLEPVVPIDWKLNLALMTMSRSGAIGAGECWLVDPAPIAQMSMRPAAILPS